MVKDQTKPSRRRALLTTASIGSALVGYPTAIAATEEERDYAREKFDADDFDEEDLHNEEGELDLPDSVLEEYEVVVYDQNTEEQRDDIAVHMGKTKDEEPITNRVTTQNWSSPTYFTFVETSLPSELGGHSFSIQGGLRVRGNPTDASFEVSIDFTASIGATDLELLGVQVSNDEDDGFCGEAREPPQVPLEIEPCFDLEWGLGTELSVGASIDICTTDACSFWDRYDCQVCRGVGGSTDIDIADYA